MFRPLFPGTDGSPLNVYYAKVTPEKNSYLTGQRFEEMGLSQAKLEESCVVNWLADHTQLDWERMEVSDGRSAALTLRSESDVISSILLSNGHLKGMHRHFGADVIYIAVPDRFSVLVYDDQVLLATLANKMYQDAATMGTEMTSCVFVVEKGQVVACDQKVALKQGMEADEQKKEEIIPAMERVIAQVFASVSSGRGKVGEKEIVKFEERLDDTADEGETLAHQACAAILDDDFAVVTEAIERNSEMAVFETMGLLSVLGEQLSEKEFDSLKKITLDLAGSIAGESGGTMGFGSKISKKETLGAIEAMFEKRTGADAIVLAGQLYLKLSGNQGLY